MEKPSRFLIGFPTVERIFFGVGLPPLMLLSLLGVMSVATLVTILFSRLSFRESGNDPFLPYASVFPGQRWGSALSHEFLCSESTQPSPADVSEQCIYHPQTGPFSLVMVTIWDDLIVRLEFTVYKNALMVGDLSMLWGRPAVSGCGPLTIAQWGNYVVTATTQSQEVRCSYFSSVSQVSFAR